MISKQTQLLNNFDGFLNHDELILFPCCKNFNGIFMNINYLILYSVMSKVRSEWNVKSKCFVMYRVELSENVTVESERDGRGLKFTLLLNY